MPFFTTQAELLHRIASLRHDWLDSMFLFLNYFDTVYFMMIIIPLVWILISPAWGLRIAILMILSSIINFHLKEFFQEPRPIIDFPYLPMLPFRSPGFPSGAAQTAALLGALLVYYWKGLWAWVIAISFSLLIGFSRLYLAVHYPTDVLGGYAIGLAIFFAFIYSITHIEKFCEKQGRGLCIAICIIIGFLYAFLLPSDSNYFLTGAFLGFCIGMYGSLRFRLNQQSPRSLSTRILDALAVVSIVYALYFLMPSYTPPGIQSFIIAIWISLAALPFCRVFVPTIESQKLFKSKPKIRK